MMPFTSTTMMQPPFMVTNRGMVCWYLDPDAPGVWMVSRGQYVMVLGNRQGYGALAAHNLASAYRPQGVP